MPSNQTTNYQLSQWVKSDQVKMEDFNADNAKLDAALASHAAALAGKGNCRVEAFSYIGQSSQDGQGLTRRFPFSKRPAFVLIFGANCVHLMSGRAGEGIFVGTYSALNGSRTVTSTTFTWEGNTAVIDNHFRQVRMDLSGVSYQLIAWIPEDEEE